jgi:DNA-binding response OmpR family regulator
LDLLVALAGQHGLAVSREDLYRRAWGYSMPPGDRSVDVYIRKLRSKLERTATRFKYIHTHFRVGYRFEPLCSDLEVVSGGPLPASRDESLPLESVRV